MKLYQPVNKIILETPKKFQETIREFREVSEFPKYRINDGVSSKENKYTLNANTCAILGMSNGRNTYLGHYAPEYKTFSFKDMLDRIVKTFQDETGELSAIITGGYDFNAGKNINQSKDSFELVANIAEILDKNNAKLSVIAAKRNPIHKEHLAITKDSFILTQSPNKYGDKVFEGLTEQSSHNKIEDMLYKQYSIAEIDPEHKLNFIG